MVVMVVVAAANRYVIVGLLSSSGGGEAVMPFPSSVVLKTHPFISFPNQSTSCSKLVYRFLAFCNSDRAPWTLWKAFRSQDPNDCTAMRPSDAAVWAVATSSLVSIELGMHGEDYERIVSSETGWSRRSKARRERKRAILPLVSMVAPREHH